MQVAPRFEVQWDHAQRELFTYVDGKRITGKTAAELAAALQGMRGADRFEDLAGYIQLQLAAPALKPFLNGMARPAVLSIADLGRERLNVKVETWMANDMFLANLGVGGRQAYDDDHQRLGDAAHDAQRWLGTLAMRTGEADGKAGNSDIRTAMAYRDKLAKAGAELARLGGPSIDVPHFDGNDGVVLLHFFAVNVVDNPEADRRERTAVLRYFAPHRHGKLEPDDAPALAAVLQRAATTLARAGLPVQDGGNLRTAGGVTFQPVALGEYRPATTPQRLEVPDERVQQYLAAKPGPGQRNYAATDWKLLGARIQTWVAERLAEPALATPEDRALRAALSNLERLSPAEAILVSNEIAKSVSDYNYTAIDKADPNAQAVATQMDNWGVHEFFDPEKDGVCRNYSQIVSAVFDSLKGAQAAQTSQLTNTYVRMVGSKDHAWNAFFTVMPGGAVAVTQTDATWDDGRPGLRDYTFGQAKEPADWAAKNEVPFVPEARLQHLMRELVRAAEAGQSANFSARVAGLFDRPTGALDKIITELGLVGDPSSIEPAAIEAKGGVPWLAQRYAELDIRERGRLLVKLSATTQEALFKQRGLGESSIDDVHYQMIPLSELGGQGHERLAALIETLPEVLRIQVAEMLTSDALASVNQRLAAAGKPPLRANTARHPGGSSP